MKIGKRIGELEDVNGVGLDSKNTTLVSDVAYLLGAWNKLDQFIQFENSNSHIHL